jgi:hypothetical protein
MSAEQFTPDRTLNQRREALAQANHIRSTRAALKRDLAHSDKATALDKAIAIVDQPRAEHLTMKVYDLLLTLPGVGHVRVRQFLDTIHCSPSKTVGGITPRQRTALVAALRHYQQHVQATHHAYRDAA